MGFPMFTVRLPKFIIDSAPLTLQFKDYFDAINDPHAPEFKLDDIYGEKPIVKKWIENHLAKANIKPKETVIEVRQINGCPMMRYMKGVTAWI